MLQIISNPINIRYLTGLNISAGIIVLSGKKIELFTDSRYLEIAKSAPKKISVHNIDNLSKRLKKAKKVRFESEDITVSRLNRWKKLFKGTKLIPAEEIIEKIRRRKSNEEIKNIKKACAITDEIMKKIPRMLKPGIKESKLSWKIESLAHELGAESMSFDSIVAFGKNSSKPHHKPGNSKLKKGDVIQIDIGVKVNGYCSDCSRVFFASKPTDKQKQVFDLLSKTVTEVTKLTKTGCTNISLDKAARKILGEYEEYFIHSLGHGVGLEVHEGPSISQKAKKVKLLENEVITIEPGIYFPGKWGMRIEDTVVVGTKNGKRLTKSCY
ncbi:aminopeptidase P family protein [Candidatus Peribacteria bacterium]|nr:aminopeptidase P family protein [Candidatus Peribacteria bacterium]MBT4021366.1 aminopeptidase P family protein [Candidatus Peribacteria bacterium]MBT4240538.1 aminopeptidase P family protein [Candidatus Peribacteria bacterium]MBT4474410.1 aminopeptidase P family protein [Candidatus Peribacteria bacterium]